MVRRAKKLQEIKDIFEENEIDFTLFDDTEVLKELRGRLGIITDKRHESYVKDDASKYKKTVDKEHSGIVTREYFLSDDIKWLYNREKWAGLKAIGLEKKANKKKNRDTVYEERLFIVSFMDIGDFSRAVREHWGVETDCIGIWTLHLKMIKILP